MNILIPGRHHCLTQFQFNYLYRVIQNGLTEEPGADLLPLGITEKVDSVIFAVTSANHSNTRRNPVPFHLRAMALLDFSQELEVPAYVFGIDDVGHLEDFAGYTLKKIHHESEGMFDLQPENTIVLCSTPVLEMYEKKGFRILPAELEDRKSWEMKTVTPWDLVEMIAAAGPDWKKDEKIFDLMHQASYLIWKQYRLGEKVQKLFSDDMISGDGDLTVTRDYNAYVRQMDEIAGMKYRETAPYLRPGRIGDIGCAVGSWIQLACKDPKYRESDFYGIEVARHLYNICLQRKENGEFESQYVFFSQKNAVTGYCFDLNSMNTIHTSSLTHEIESYGDREDLLKFIRNRYEELAPGGAWVNRDVVGPQEKDKPVLLWTNEADGRNDDWEKDITERQELRNYLDGLSTRTRFLRFARDFRKNEDYHFSFAVKTINGQEYFELTLEQAMEFITKKDYTENWLSEMHEMFCFWSFNDWKKELIKAGFHIDPHSRAYTNDWLVRNRYEGKVALFEEKNGALSPVEWPHTHMLMVAEKR